MVTGATGYIGGRLVPALLAEGHRVRCLARHPDKLRDVPWAADVEIVQGDLTSEADIRAAVAGCEVLYFLVHSLQQHGFAAKDRRAALLSAQAAREAGLRRIVYLGGLHPVRTELSEHLSSRAEVGEILLRSGVPCAVLQAAVIIGSGSASFEMLRYLTERLPLMIAPKWIHNRVQPIAIADVLRYLVGAATLPTTVSRTFDIGGPDVLSYLEMMHRYAEVAGLPQRRVLPVPLLTPKLSSHWVNLVTPVPGSLATPLIESLIHDAVCREDDIRQLIPDPKEGRRDYRRAVSLALEKVRAADVATRWSGASLPDAPSDPLPSDPAWSGGSMFRDQRERHTTAPASEVWRVVEGIGGEQGWYSFPLAWAIRGWADRLMGGVGLRRGRRDPSRLQTGDVLDWWRVEDLQRGRLLRLRAEMRMPGRAWLELRVDLNGSRTRFRQRAVFLPHGLAGYLYWWLLWPFHGIVFGGMLRNILLAAERNHAQRQAAGERTP
ncbi:SDR family oxidoreductase [Actinoalloteichus hymeniacidonis]|uniref:SDR family oxidoreductase n=1 Tax=Actinoalloteichus hymeniacidonis TaxID=340345 RepID=UPI001C84409C|nr:SDR family oxidoreductase [Actinoalloteichus hymeniacidonis]